MARYVAFLRGINLGGHRAADKGQLRSAFEELGYGGVATFRASGNVIFDAGEREGPQPEIAARIERGLAGSLGYEVPVYLRSAAQVRAIAAHQPFDARRVASSSGKLQVALLLDSPGSSARREVAALATDADALAIRGRELYWLPAGGTRDSALDLRAVEASVGPWTMRTKGTIEQIAARQLAD